MPRGLYFSKAGPGAHLIFRGAYLRREICVSKSIGLALYIVGSKFTVFALFYFVFDGNFPITSPRGAYIWRGDLTEGFLRYRFGGVYINFGGAYTWRGLFSEFYGMSTKQICIKLHFYLYWEVHLLLYMYIFVFYYLNIYLKFTFKTRV